MIIIMLMLAEQLLQREPERQKRGERERHGRMERRLEASQPSVRPSSVFNDPQHLTRAHLSSF